MVLVFGSDMKRFRRHGLVTVRVLHPLHLIDAKQILISRRTRSVFASTIKLRLSVRQTDDPDLVGLLGQVVRHAGAPLEVREAVAVEERRRGGIGIGLRGENRAIVD